MGLKNLMRLKKKKQPEKRPNPTYGTMKVLGMETSVKSMQMIKGTIEVVAIFGPGKSVTMNPEDEITLHGTDGTLVHTVLSDTPQVVMMLGDTLELVVHLETHELRERWAFGR